MQPSASCLPPESQQIDSGDRSGNTRRPLVLVSIPMDRCVKNFLDTQLYLELVQKFDVCIISYLSENEGFRSRYGGPGISFLESTRFTSRLRGRLFNFVEIIRLFGFYFKWRRSIGRLHWFASTRYRYPEDYVRNSRATPRHVRGLLIGLIASIGTALRLHRLIPRWLGHWYMSAPILESWLDANSPVAYLATAHRTDQEKFLSFHAGRRGIRSILIPDSWDNFIVDGFLFHEFDSYGVMGPEMAAHLSAYHGVQPNRMTSLGVPVRRMYEEQIKKTPYDLRAAFDIPPGLPILTYIAVSTSACYDTVDIIEELARAVEAGVVQSCVILVRTQPGQDPSEYFDRLQGYGCIRIQVAGNRGGGGEGAIDFDRSDENVEYAASIAQASVVVSNISACVIDACVADIPTIINAIELSTYPERGFSPRAIAELDPFGLVQAGLPVAWSMAELFDHIKRALEDHSYAAPGRRSASKDWDYAAPDYKERFMKMISPTADWTPI